MAELEDRARGSAVEVARVFGRLGLTSFGGPIAHLGYFRTEFVERRRWLSEAAYADLVALAQFLPGPASSQVGFALGLMRAGPWGALAAFVAFTLPSAVLMLGFAYGVGLLSGPVATGAVAGLKIVAVAVVAQAVRGMAQGLTPDAPRAAIALGAAVLALAPTGGLGQFAAIAAGAAAGAIWCRATPGAGDTAAADPGLPRRVAPVCLGIFAVLLVGLPWIATGGALQAASAFYGAGALVFGGGHVVLPLLDGALVQPGFIGAETFLAGYGAAQALPGPLFSIAAYLGALADVGPGGVAGAALALAAIFLPGFLLMLAALRWWAALRRRVGVQAVLRGANAAVVGILGAALYDPLFTTSVTGPGAFALALACFVALTVWRWPPLAVVVAGAAGGVALALV